MPTKAFRLRRLIRDAQRRERFHRNRWFRDMNDANDRRRADRNDARVASLKVALRAELKREKAATV